MGLHLQSDTGHPLSAQSLDSYGSHRSVPRDAVALVLRITTLISTMVLIDLASKGVKLTEIKAGIDG